MEEIMKTKNTNPAAQAPQQLPLHAGSQPIVRPQPPTTEELCQDYVREVTARYIGPRRKSPTLHSPDNAVNFMRDLLRDDAREHFLALYLNGAHQVISCSLVSLGCATSAIVHPREVFQGAILVGACALIVGHNHPSSELNPSQEDLATTKKLRDAGTLLSIPLLDHLLFSRTGYVSFKDRGILE
jgi:DNA repair protein RadC